MYHISESVDVRVCVSMYSLSDNNGDITEHVNGFTVDSDLDVFVSLDGYLVNKEDYELLQWAQGLSDEAKQVLEMAETVQSK